MSNSKVRKTIVLTGGGTAGHVMPHIALIPLLKSAQWRIEYVGTAGIEKKLMLPLVEKYHTIVAGKLRRYFSFQNVLDIFNLFFGMAQSFVLLYRIKPDIVFSKGGFVSVPVAVSAWLQGIPVVTHESDLSPGLANRIIIPLAKRILYSFSETRYFLPKIKSVYTGSPVRPSVLEGNKVLAYQLCSFDSQSSKPVVLIMGGSQGALAINTFIEKSWEKIIPHFRIVLISGKGKGFELAHKEVKIFEYVDSELADLFDLADVVMSRAGANTLFELFALKKPMLLTPLEHGSRGDQLDNAKSFEKQGWAKIILESDLKVERFIELLTDLLENRELLSKTMTLDEQLDSAALVMENLNSVAGFQNK